MASRSRWLVGSSSSSRSARRISARARLRRMRQPPEKLAHRARQLLVGKSQPIEQLRGAGRRGVAFDGLEAVLGLEPGGIVHFRCQHAFQLAQFAVAVEHELQRRSARSCRFPAPRRPGSCPAGRRSRRHRGGFRRGSGGTGWICRSRSCPPGRRAGWRRFAGWHSGRAGCRSGNKSGSGSITWRDNSRMSYDAAR